MTIQEINGLKIQANVFCRHKNVRDWFFYRTEYTISKIILDAEDHWLEIDMVFEDLLNYTEGLLEVIIELELYELCAKVENQTNKLAEELRTMSIGINKLNKAQK